MAAWEKNTFLVKVFAAWSIVNLIRGCRQQWSHIWIEGGVRGGFEGGIGGGKLRSVLFCCLYAYIDNHYGWCTLLKLLFALVLYTRYLLSGFEGVSFYRIAT